MHLRLLDPGIRRNPARYLIQCGLATAILAVIFSFEDVFVHAALFAAVGSTTFILFATPTHSTARMQHVIGGAPHRLALGGAIALALATPFAQDLQLSASYIVDLGAALAVGSSILVMAATNTEHLPAAGTALGTVLTGWSPSTVAFIVTSVVALSLIHRVLRSQLRSLV